MKELSAYHYANCEEYKRISDVIGNSVEKMVSQEDCLFLPVRIFKDMELKSVPDEEIFKTMTSSGTTGQQVSKIFLDRETSSNQQKTLVKIVSDFTGKASRC